jgi:hypothetical protein
MADYELVRKIVERFDLFGHSPSVSHCSITDHEAAERLRETAHLTNEEQFGLIERVTLPDGGVLIVERDPSSTCRRRPMRASRRTPEIVPDPVG